MTYKDEMKALLRAYIADSNREEREAIEAAKSKAQALASKYNSMEAGIRRKYGERVAGANGFYQGSDLRMLPLAKFRFGRLFD